MKTFDTAAIALAGLILTLTTSSASAQTITYVLSGRASGDYLKLGDPDAVAQDFDLTHFQLDLTGALPGSEIGGDDVTPIDSGVLRVDGLTLDVDLPASELFAIDPTDGDAAFGREGVSGFVPTVRLRGSGLDGYDGMTSLPKTPVRADFLKPFRVTLDGQGFEITIDDVAHARFSALVPEPAAWALMSLGVLGAGSVLRRQRAALAPA